MDRELLRKIPKVDELIAVARRESTEIPVSVLTEAVRGVLTDLRMSFLDGSISNIPSHEVLCRQALERAQREMIPSLRGAVNATGVILHTNLGRACLSDRAARNVAAVAGHYSTVEYDVERGERGSRNAHVETLLCRLSGAESALVVNNNAAAVLLLLTALTVGGEVVISRGELVEIGGSFRVPDIMAACGAILHEVGTTNKTRVEDYANAINEKTKALLKVHTSNYKIVGFTESVSTRELCDLGGARSIPVFVDLGSGCLTDLEQFGIRGEPTVQDAVLAGADVVSFSGDKLLGGPQAGILVGKKIYIDALKKHPLIRALRPGKMTLAALQATLCSYMEEREKEDIPTIAMLSQSPEELREKAEKLCRILVERGVDADVAHEEDVIGGGSVPGQMLPSFAASVTPTGCNATALAEHLRCCKKPIIARIEREKLLLCVRTIRTEDIDYVAQRTAETLQGLHNEPLYECEDKW